jgi:hypothetical protein
MSEDKSLKKNIDLNKYEDPTGVSSKNLSIGLWLVENRKILYKTLIIILATIAAVFLLYSGYNYFYYFTSGRDQEKVLLEDNSGVNLSGYRETNKPIDIQLESAKFINTKNGSDLVALIKNTNEKQYASFDYCFSSSDNRICGSNFILPNEEKSILAISNNFKVSSGQVKFELANVKWQKLKAGEIPDWNAFKNERLRFNISEPKFSTYNDTVNYLEFEITNESAYGYFEVPLNIIITRNGETVAVNRYIVKDLDSKIKKSIRLSWPEASSLNGQIKIKPDLNIISSNIYKPYRSN